MSKKDFVVLARAFYEAKPDSYDYNEHYAAARSTWANTVEVVANELRENYSRFDKDRFVEACHSGKGL